MMGLLNSVKKRMSSREGHQLPNQSATPFTTTTGTSNNPHFVPAAISIPTAAANASPPSVPTEGVSKVSSRSSTKRGSDASRSPVARGGRKSVSASAPETQTLKPEKRSASSPNTDTKEKRSQDLRFRPPGLVVAKQDPDIFNRLPPLKDASAHDCMDLLQKKLMACGDVIFDFKGPAADLYLTEKEAKKDTLTEVLDFVNEPRRGSPELIVEDLIKMISANIFRPLPPASVSVMNLMAVEPEENEPNLEAAWPHLQVVYEILLRFIMSTEVNPKTAKKFMDHTFVLKLLDLFASEDPRERDYLKTVMHRVYGKIMALRAFIRKAIQNVFFRYIHERDGDAGVSELLEILGSIINGFAQPLKEEHKIFLKRCMIPLHKTRNLMAYHQQLTYCMTQYIEKDNKLVEPIINGLLRYWPVTNTPKEVLFLNEVEEILELTPSSEFQKIMEPLFKRLALCIRSPHFQVAERVLFLWNNTRIVKLVNQNKNVLFPIIIGALYKNNKDHWNVTVHGLTFNVCKLLAETDPHLFDHCNEENIQREERREVERTEKRQRWEALRKSPPLSETGEERR